jgi:hypothetical protein
VLVGFLVLNRLDDYFLRQQQADLESRAESIAQFVEITAFTRAGSIGPVVTPDGLVDEAVVADLSRGGYHRLLADVLAQADVTVRVGTIQNGQFVPAPNGTFRAEQNAHPRPGQQREEIPTVPHVRTVAHPFFPYAIEVVLNNPYTFRATAVQNVAGLLIAIGLFALGLSMIVAAGLARRFTTPLRRLTDPPRGR